MEFLFRCTSEETLSTERFMGQPEFQRCPFLRNINEPTSFSFSSPMNFAVPVKGTKGPIFEDGPHFDMAFRLFHGRDGVVPLSGSSMPQSENLESKPSLQFNPLAANAATISVSAFGPGGPFSFDSFSDRFKPKKKSQSNNKRDSSSKGHGPSSHEAHGNDWLKSGNCPIAKSYRAVSHVLPLIAKAIQPPPGMKFKCPPAVVAARAALAKTAFVKNLRPQPLPAKVLTIAMLGMAANVPLGIWREHTVKFSPSWFVAVHAAVPFIAMLRKSVLMPKTAMAVTIAASILGQVIGSRAERFRLRAVMPGAGEEVETEAETTTESSRSQDGLINSGHCGGESVKWDGPGCDGLINSGHCGGDSVKWDGPGCSSSTGVC